MSKLTTIRLLGERKAMQVVGMPSVNRWVYSAMGDRARDVMAWVEAEPLRTTMHAHWSDGALMGVYVMFERTAHSERQRQETSNALTMFAMAFKGAEGFEWESSTEQPTVRRIC